MKTVRRLLPENPRIWSTTPSAPVHDAIRLMVEKDVGALVVLDAGKLSGIVTERDVARKLLLNGRPADHACVRDIMTERVLYVRPDQTVDECMAIMTERHLRHLPVIDDGKLLGVVSIRDLVADLIAEKSFLIEQLENYIYAIPPFRTA